MLPINYCSWQDSFLELPKSCQESELTFLSIVVFRATKFPATLKAVFPVAFRATKNLQEIMLPVNYLSWQGSFLELPKPCQQKELTFLSPVAFRAAKILTTLTADVSVAFNDTRILKTLCLLSTIGVSNVTFRSNRSPVNNDRCHSCWL